MEFDLQRFGGSDSTTTQSRTIPDQTATEASLQNGLYNYSQTGLSNASSLQSQANSAYNNYGATMSGVNSGYSNLANGVLPSAYAANRQAALNADLTGTVGSSINSLGNRGILNSSTTGSALNQISQNASNTLAKDYTSDLSTESGLLGQQASSAANTASTLQSAANSQASAGTNLFNQLYSGRMGTSGVTTTSNDGGASAYSALGTLGTAAIMCFIGGTIISVPNGYKRIEDICVGDEVYSLDEDNNSCIEKVTWVQEPVISPNNYVKVIADKSEVTTTDTQPFVTEAGDILPYDLVGELILMEDGYAEVLHVLPVKEKELVYDFSTSGINIYFANGLAARGRE